ncbi:hypothetical protein U0358_05950 [Idiomarina sp. PL1-037]|uniref:hypothetical protein n=1 Tax=Idiomarina sp. PL1-037 TaxID=3095365 RepID=UPI002ACC0D42|nr:hypothetical protein [Idiomarina sp. PL1-037]WQC54091.1 hypothetical protein U0358_05950 [Idiomarina sp. PL1-037]
MTPLKQPLLHLWGGLCLLVFTTAVIDIVFFWSDTGFDWMFLGKKVIYAIATGYWVWRFLIEPYRKRKVLETKSP